MSGFGAALGEPSAVEGTLRRMAPSLEERGPAGTATWRDGGTGLMETRDAVPGEPYQVAALGDGTRLVGDVLLEGPGALDRALADAGHAPPSTATDPLRALLAYRAWGAEGFGRLAGEYGFALWDPVTGRLFAVRDPFGVRPVYWARWPGGVAVSNTVSALLGCPGVGRGLDEGAVVDHLLFEAVGEPEATVWAGIRRVPPAHLASWGAGPAGPELHRHWRLPEVEGATREPEAWAEGFRTALLEATRDRLGGSSCAAVTLSGGLDSTAVAACCVEAGVRPAAFTAGYATGFPDPEPPLAAEAAEALGLDHRIQLLDGHRLYDDLAGAAPALPGGGGSRGMEQDLDAAITAVGRGPSAAPTVLTGFGGDPILLPSTGGWSDRPLRWLMGLWRTWRLTGRRPPFGLATAVARRRLRRTWRRGFPAWLDPDFARRTDALDRWRHHALGGVGDHPRGHRSEARFHLSHPRWGDHFELFDAGQRGSRLRFTHPFFDQRVV
ncbi:MAG: asparagine synthase-related protein, partial [Acidobacteriota bacterium]